MNKPPTLLENVPDRGSAIAVAERIGEALEAPFELEGSEVLVSASVGIAMNEDPDHDTSENLLREPNVAMHGAKKKGKARHVVFEPGAQTTTGGRLVHEAEMRRALRKKEFRVYYQPVVSLKNSKRSRG